MLVLDQVSKYVVASNFELNQPWYPFSFLKPLFSITYIHNTGAAFGMLQNQNLLFTIIAIVVVIVILVYVRSTPQPDLLIALALGLQLGGACGNLVDRLRFGYVTDFLYVKYWAISNVADICITTGVLLLAYQLIFRTQQSTPAQPTSTTSTAATPPTADGTTKSEIA